MQSAPAADLDAAARGVLLLQPHVRVAPGRLVATAEGGAVAPWPTTMALATRARLRRPEEHAIIPEAHQHGGSHLSQTRRQQRGAVAPVEDEERDRAIGQMVRQGRHLADGHRLGPLAGCQPHRVDWRGPRRPLGPELRHPRVRPAGHDRLAGRVPRRVVDGWW